MKAGAPMGRRSHMELSSIIVFLGILSILLQFAAYYFFASPYLVLGISSLVVIICAYILQEQSLTFESCFIYTTLILFISIIITSLTYLESEASIMPFSNTLYGIIVVNWFIPTLYCLVRNLFDYSSRLENFVSYYRNVSILFILFYIGIIIYGSFGENAFPWAYPSVLNNKSLTPFWSLATQIEDYINQLIPISDILTYLFSRIFTFVPYGFYSILLLRNTSKFIRFISLLIFPSIIELLQYYIIPGRFDLDDVIYALIGGIVGALLFHLINTIYYVISGRPFLIKDSANRYSNSTLHF
jgi:glycopeptide antibiotics resistance protein